MQFTSNNIESLSLIRTSFAALVCNKYLCSLVTTRCSIFYSESNDIFLQYILWPCKLCLLKRTSLVSLIRIDFLRWLDMTEKLNFDSYWINWNRIVFTIFQLIWNQTEIHLVCILYQFLKILNTIWFWLI